MPVLPQEDPKELEDRTQQAITAMRSPAIPSSLIWFAARCGWRGSSIAPAGRDGPPGPPGPNGHAVGDGHGQRAELKRVHDLGSKLFFQAAIRAGFSDSTADDYPAVIVRRLEESAEGCRWLLARWAELLNVLDRKAAWRDPEIVRFVGLLGRAVSRPTSTRNSIPSSMPSMRSATAAATSSGRTTEMGSVGL